MFFSGHIGEVRAVVGKQRLLGKRLGLVPTMGALHQGHRALVDQLRSNCDFLMMWIFVNPLQFNSLHDYQQYPRDIEQDRRLAEEWGIELLFAPTESEIYPRGIADYQNQNVCRVSPGDRSRTMEGKFRPGHFDGVVQVVNIFFNILSPDVAAFGEKDYQQVQVVQQLVADLHLGVEILVVPIVREQNGLALSSRNQLLGENSVAAEIISRSLREASRSCLQGENSSEALVNKVKADILSAGLKIEYVEVVDRQTLEQLSVVSSTAQLLVAAVVGSVRLIDNIALTA